MKLKKYTKKRELLSCSFANLNLLLLLRCLRCRSASSSLRCLSSLSCDEVKLTLAAPFSSILLQNVIQYLPYKWVEQRHDTFWQFKELYISCRIGQNMLRKDAVEPRYNEGIKLTQFKYLRTSLSGFLWKNIVFVLSKLSVLNIT